LSLPNLWLCFTTLGAIDPNNVIAHYKSNNRESGDDLEPMRSTVKGRDAFRANK
jgi:hypothetical protein